MIERIIKQNQKNKVAYKINGLEWILIICIVILALEIKTRKPQKMPAPMIRAGVRYDVVCNFVWSYFLLLSTFCNSTGSSVVM
mgnify:CR=1 FL=1